MFDEGPEREAIVKHMAHSLQVSKTFYGQTLTYSRRILGYFERAIAFGGTTPQPPTLQNPPAGIAEDNPSTSGGGNPEPSSEPSPPQPPASTSGAGAPEPSTEPPTRFQTPAGIDEEDSSCESVCSSSEEAPRGPRGRGSPPKKVVDFSPYKDYKSMLRVHKIVREEVKKRLFKKD